MSQKTIFITGASSGLGKSTAILFAQKGWKVFATMRNPQKENELTQYPAITLLALDVTNPEQIKKAAATAIAAGDIDVVFNNAGYGIMGPLEAVTEEQLTQQIDTNLLGVIRTTQAFLQHFREKKSGLFITTTSIGGLAAFPLCSVYHATKWALEGWSESMSFELSQFGIGIKTVSPGNISTDFAGRSLVYTSHDAYAQVAEKVGAVFTNPERRSKGSTPEQIAAIVYEAATDGKDQLRYVAGLDATELYAHRLETNPEIFRKEIAHTFLD